MTSTRTTVALVVPVLLLAGTCALADKPELTPEKTLANLQRRGATITQSAIGNRKEVVAIDLQYVIWDRDDKLPDCFRLFPHLERLSVKGSELSREQFAMLARLTSLRALDLEKTEIKPKDLLGLRPLKKLEFLSLSENREIDDDALPTVLAFENLRELRLADTDITDIGIAVLPRLSKLEILDLSRNSGIRNAGITDHGLKSLQKMRLKQLNLHSTKVTDEGVPLLFKITTLERLSLKHGFNLTDKAVAEIGSLKKLVALDLTNPLLTGATLARVAGLPMLEELSLGEHDLKDADLIVLPRMMSLRKLVLEKTDIGDAGMGHIVACKELTSLNLDLTEVTDGGVVRLLKCPKLRELRLNTTKVTDASLETLGKFPALQVLDVTGSKVTKAGVQTFVKKHPRIKVYSNFENDLDD